jgi:phenylpyruvate tautomerase PptA (4-oxalocrotonate tautomerase family)
VPNAAIEVCRPYSREEEVAMINAVHAAMIEGLKIPEWDKTVRLIVHEPHRFATPPGIGDRYTLVNIDLFVGRSLEAKKALYRALVKNLEPLGIPPDHVKVLLREIPRENWGMRGGFAASELELGYEVNV